MREDDLVEKWCFELGLENEGWLNKGDFGNAYDISDNKVIKITRDNNEFIQTFNILGNDSDNLPEVYEMRVFPDGTLGILMEKLVTDDVDDLFNSWNLESEIAEVDLINFDSNDLIDQNLKKFVDDIQNSIFEFNKKGVGFFDIHDGNIGLNKNGNYVLFDQTIKNSNEYNEDMLEDIRIKLLENYNIKDPIIKKDVPASKIIISEKEVKDILSDLNNKTFENIKTDDFLTCFYNKNGDIQLLESPKILLNSLINSKVEFDVKIIRDERLEFFDYEPKSIEIDEYLELDEDLFYGGLENIIEEKKLDEYIDNIEKIKKSNKNKLKL